MAVLYITEFSNAGLLAADQAGMVKSVPPIAEQTVAIGAGSVASAAFNAATTAVRIQADAVCSVAFGAAPVATATSMRVPANSPGEVFRVVPGQKIAVITNV